MTNREREFAALGMEYAEGIESAKAVHLPSGRMVNRVARGWESQPWNDNYWRTFCDLLDAIRFATRPESGGAATPSAFAAEKALPL